MTEYDDNDYYGREWSPDGFEVDRKRIEYIRSKLVKQLMLAAYREGVEAAAKASAKAGADVWAEAMATSSSRVDTVLDLIDFPEEHSPGLKDVPGVYGDLELMLLLGSQSRS